MTDYKKQRRLLFVGVITLGVVGLGWWLYADFTAPVPVPITPQQISMEPPKSSTPPNNNEKQEYTVPGPHPRRLIIASIGVDALVKPVGVLSSGALDAPKTAWDVGWYDKSGLPGQTGTMVIDGHVNDSYNTPGIFGSLKQLKSDDKLTIERGDGTLLNYRITTVEQTPVDRIDMKRLFQPSSGNEGLNLITCGGTYDKKTGRYSDRIVVSAVRT